MQSAVTSNCPHFQPSFNMLLCLSSAANNPKYVCCYPLTDRPRKRLSRWANAVMFARALTNPMARTLPPPKGASAAASKAPASKAPASKVTFTERIQARVVPLIDKAAVLIAGTSNIYGHSSSSNGSLSNTAAQAGKGGVAVSSDSGVAADNSGAEAVPDAAAASDDTCAVTAKAKLKGLTQRAAAAAGKQ
jgi:hypothetical protein